MYVQFTTSNSLFRRTANPEGSKILLRTKGPAVSIYLSRTKASPFTFARETMCSTVIQVIHVCVYFVTYVYLQITRMLDASPSVHDRLKTW